MNIKEELNQIITKFAESGWELIDAPSAAWLKANHNGEASEEVTNELIESIKKADLECGSCGCEFDPLYKKALVLLQNA